MNTYPCAELRAKHDYSSITATLTLQLVHRQLQINIDDSIATIVPIIRSFTGYRKMRCARYTDGFVSERYRNVYRIIAWSIRRAPRRYIQYA